MHCVVGGLFRDFSPPTCVTNPRRIMALGPANEAEVTTIEPDSHGWRGAALTVAHSVRLS
jgi:hypothetical protein